MLNDHFHDRRSSDAREPLASHREAARAAGFRDICVTNHAEALNPDGDWTVDPLEARARFLAQADEVRALNRAGDGPAVRLGAEFEYRPEWTDRLDDLAREVPFDLVLGSVHLVDGRNISGGPHVERAFRERPAREVYRRYFETVGEMVRWGGFDVVAHFDLVTRYGHRELGPYDPREYESEIRAALDAMAARRIGIEINTSGVGQAPGVPYPDRRILEWAREAGVSALTIGTDSHAPARFGRGIREGLRLAQEAGWEEISLFRDRRVADRRPVAGLLREASA